MDTPRLRLQSEVKQLEADLIEAHKAYLVAIKERPDEAEDLAAVGALSAVCNFLNAVGIESRYWVPLLRLWAPKVEDQLNLARAAYAVTLLMKAGEKSALKKVSNAAGLDIARLENFRKNIMGKQPRGPKIAVDLYRNLASAGARSGLSLEIQAQTILGAVGEKNDRKV